MKINHNNRLITSGLAALAVAGLTVGASACSGDADRGAEVRIEASDDATNNQSTSDNASGVSADRAGDVVSSATGARSSRGVSTGATSASTSSASASSASADATSAETPAAETPASDTPAAETPASDTPAAETPASDTPASDAPVEIPSGDTGPGTGGAPTLEIPMNPGATAELILFVGTNGDLDASLFLKESGFGGNDIVSVKLVYYVGDTKTTTGATLSRETSNIRSIWNAKNMNLSSGDSVSVRITNSKGVTTYIDKVVEITAAV
jgi:hypothetical protein